MAAYHTCATCGRPFERRSPAHRHCGACEKHGRAYRSPTTRAQNSEYRRNRARILAGSPVCAYCPRPATTADHIVPVSKGGSNKLANLAPCCASCNRAKSNRDDWQPLRDDAVPEPRRTTPGLI